MAEYFCGMGEWAVGQAGDILCARGLGSCIGLVLIDNKKRMAAMAHVMLPSSNGKTDMPTKYADTAVNFLLEQLRKNGSSMDISSKMAGGAKMFNVSESSLLDIGRRNAEALENSLKEAGITLVSKDVGGSFARTVTFDVMKRKFLVKTIGRGEVEI
ncbi:CheD [Thermodesulfobium narugense DSM 14796]|uniref:Probable chemoreceptor glutamine deamidase CheD n=1 Tax=Thermodesulfobium narugense DSM 14796 TaxID=747365 RepID=M1E5C2_9BACT|nr:chemotaxis protein CheD [Thermodesulfobium narugense]AEE13673.1 CheD [Thermodesulfobium narugense DSM 14796]